MLHLLPFPFLAEGIVLPKIKMNTKTPFPKLRSTVLVPVQQDAVYNSRFYKVVIEKMLGDFADFLKVLLCPVQV